MMEQSDFTISSYNRHVSEGKLMASRCEKCDILYLPPRPVCPECHGTDMGWKELSGKGKVIGYTAITIVPTGMAAKGYGRDKPYLSAVVQTEEGPGITAMLEGFDATDPGVSVDWHAGDGWVQRGGRGRRGKKEPGIPCWPDIAKRFT